ISIFNNRTIFYFNYFHWIGKMGPTNRNCCFNKLLNSFWSINHQWFHSSLERTAAQKTGKTKNMISMQMCDKYLIDFPWFQRGVQNLMLCCFPAIKEPDMIFFLQ